MYLTAFGRPQVPGLGVGCLRGQQRAGLRFAAKKKTNTQTKFETAKPSIKGGAQSLIFIVDYDFGNQQTIRLLDPNSSRCGQINEKNWKRGCAIVTGPKRTYAHPKRPNAAVLLALQAYRLTYSATTTPPPGNSFHSQRPLQREVARSRLR